MIAAAQIASLIGWLVLALAAVGTLYWAFATWVLARFLQQEKPAAARFDAVTLLKPLYGSEPQLEANLASFLRQTHQGPLQMVCGVQRADDPAADVVRALQARHPQARIDLVVDPARHGANAKVGNLINMMARAEHDVVVLSDSDIAVEPNYLAQVLAALERPGIGAVTCLYHGRGDGGFWSRLASAGPSYQFVVGLVFGKVMGLAEPCMGSTIALRRSTLQAIGGFEAFADVLADDHAIGAAVRAQGLGIAIPPLLLAHASAEQTLTQVWRQELRWAATIRALAPAGYAGSLIGFPLALAMLGSLFHPLPCLYLAAGAFAVRLSTKRVVDRHAGASTAPWWLLPLRDALSLSVFVASYFVRVVDWRGTRLRMEDDGQTVSPAENFSS
ncbi:glycosyl transferase [Novosphingobium sediminis]|uniref:Glycosyl transferase n=1 Tax=Novosphingobium sediminis TaxID=707214 RepID=A0A512APF9_9SPHN|nr:bacteriohopanetetrol glucosamine biosynthesis glycosyltransferase HpnI [Novosphingobium sediminis]GEO01581.1 glycosyl transferase [Novosphingobium sediminis]